MCPAWQTGRITSWDLKVLVSLLSPSGHGIFSTNKEPRNTSGPIQIRERLNSLNTVVVIPLYFVICIISYCNTTVPEFMFIVSFFLFPFSHPNPGLPCEFLDINTGIGSNSSSVTFSEPSGASKPAIRLVSSAS